MTTERSINATLKTSIMNNEPFLYAHLIKFERSIKTVSSLPSKVATDYGYISDASVNIEFDDESKDATGVLNGSQTYIANRVTKIGSINETTKAKASTINIEISSEALDTATVFNQIVSWGTPSGKNSNITTTGVDFVELGFSEGDQIRIKHNVAVPDTNHNKTGTILSFSNNNKTMLCEIHGQASNGSSGLSAVTSTSHEIVIDSSHVVALFQDREASEYAGYINREVFIYKAHISTTTGDIIGEPYCIFKGIISKAKLSEDPAKSSKITWSLTSHWGDFLRVSGRLSSDSEHRGIGVNGQPDVDALHRHEYAGDLGFMHSEQAINIIAIYQVQETRYKMKSSGLFGLSKKMVEYQVTVDRDVDLRLNLEAKYLPVIYGVQRTDSIPIFADSLAADSSEIYVIYAICEGEVSGIFDLYIDDQSRICIDKNDSDTRSSQNSDKTIDVVCEGRMDRGDTLSSTSAYNRGGRGRGGALSMAGYGGSGPFGISNGVWEYLMTLNSGTSTALNASTGVTHEKRTSFDFPIKGDAIFHSGRSHQRADDMILNIAAAGASNSANGFKLQADISDDAKKYWTQNHRLLDTAYVAVKYDIAEGDVSIPEIDFVVRGKEIEQYNYDFSYRSVPEIQGYSGYDESVQRANFKAGDKVRFYATDGSSLNADVYIMDKYKYVNAREEDIYKFRFDKNPLETVSGTLTTNTTFLMVKNNTTALSAVKYQFETWDHTENSGTVGATLTQDVNTVASDTSTGTVANAASGTGIDVTIQNLTLQVLFAYLGNGNFSFGFGNSIFNFNRENFERHLDTFLADYNSTTKKVIDVGNTVEGKETITTMFVTNAIKLDSASASDVNDFYVGQLVKVNHTNSDGSIKTQTRRIVRYSGDTKIAVVGSLGPATTSNTVATGGTYTTAVVSYLNTKTVTLTSVVGIVAGDVVDGHSSEVVLATGAKVVSISGTTLTLDQFIYSVPGATLTFTRASGATATTIQPEPFDFVPRQGDTYEITPEGDKKVSINPGIQLLDYLQSIRYGRGLDLDDDIDLDSFKAAARLCDTRSDVTIFANTGTTDSFVEGDIYKYEENSTLFWQAKLKKKETRTYSGSTYIELVFTDVIGKLSRKWNNWRSFVVGELFWHYHSDAEGARVHRSSGDGHYSTLSLSDDILSNATDIVIRKVEGSGPATFNPWFSLSSTNQVNSSDDNPLIKSWDTDTNTPSKMGYSLYDCDEVKYWRYSGWQGQEQAEVTRHQTNALIRTDQPIFNNINSMLDHFNGILRYSNKKYQLDVESTVTSYSVNDPRIIDQDDIIGAITVDDGGLKGSCNTVSVSIPDPQIRYDKRSVVFFDSTYLKEDRGIPKKKDVKTPLITNYFNARLNAEQYLRQSRYSKKINFSMGPKGSLLLPGTIIKITYPRFGWEGQYYRITNLQLKQDCLVQVTAQEHDDETYIVSGKNKTKFLSPPTTTPQPDAPVVNKPTGLTATTNLQGKVKLAWNTSASFGSEFDAGGGSADWSTEIWYSDLQSATGTSTNFPQGYKPLVSQLKTSQYEHNLPELTVTSSFYYWVRHVKIVSRKSGKRIQAGSLFQPLVGDNGVLGTASAATTDRRAIFLYAVQDQDASAPTIGSTFPPLRVPLDGGNNHGQITAIGAGSNGSAAVIGTTPDYEIKDTNGALTGWFTYRPAITGKKVRYAVAATTNPVQGEQFDDIARTEWTSPVQDSGSHGLSSIVITAFNTNNTVNYQTKPSTANYTFQNQSITLDNGWSLTEEATSLSKPYVYKSTALAFAVTGATGNTIDEVTNNNWSTPTLMHTFSSGTDGSSTALVYLYKAGTTNPGSPSSSFPTVTINLTTGSFVSYTTTEGWSIAPPTPANTEKIWAVAASATSNSSTDTIDDGEWTHPVQWSGADGAPGINSTIVELYQPTNSSSAPSPDSPQGDTTFTFSNQALAGTLGNWSRTSSSVTATNSYLWKITAAAFNTASTHTIDSNDWSAPVIHAQFATPGGSGPDGVYGKRNLTGVIYYNTPQANSPGNPSVSSGGSYSFTNNVFSGLTAGWSLAPPTANPGTTQSKFWYATFFAVEGTSAANTGSGNTTGTGGSLTFGSAFVGLNFTGLVTFNSLSQSGTTSIHGDRIDTGTLNADKITLSTVSEFGLNKNHSGTTVQRNALTGMIAGDTFTVTGADLNSKYFIYVAGSTNAWVQQTVDKIGGWTLTANSIHSGTPVTGSTATFTTANGHISLNSNGSIHTPNFYSNAAGKAGFKGELTIGSSSTVVDLSAADAFDTYVANKAPIQSVVQSGSATASLSGGVLSIGATGDSLSDTTVGAGYIAMRTTGIEYGDNSTNALGNTNNSIILSTINGDNKITIFDGGVARVIIGKLT